MREINIKLYIQYKWHNLELMADLQYECKTVGDKYCPEYVQLQ